MVDYGNIPRTIGALISADKATLHECDTVYSVEDVYLMLEVVVIDAHNKRVADEWHRKQQPQR